MTPSTNLSAQDTAFFEENGYLHVKGAFPRESALAIQDYMWSQLKALNGIDRDDRSTWTRRWSGLNRSGKHPIYRQIAGKRLCGAIDGLLGPGRWEVPSSWGGFLITFPADDDKAWRLTTEQWHWDGNPAGQLNGMTGLFIFTFFSSVAPGGGGTVIVSGSHRLVVRFFDSLTADECQRKQRVLKRRFSQSQPWLAELTGYAPDRGNRIRRFMQQATAVDGVSVQAVELTGEPGDAVVCHPCIFHARSPNCADYPRFMRVKGLHRGKNTVAAIESIAEKGAKGSG